MGEGGQDALAQLLWGGWRHVEWALRAQSDSGCPWGCRATMYSWAGHALHPVIALRHEGAASRAPCGI